MNQAIGWRESYDFSHLELGIGDIICSMYGLYAFSVARGHPPIRLHMRDHFDWIKLIAIPNLTVLRYNEEEPPHIDLHLGDEEVQYREKLRDAHDPKIWYANKLGVEPLAPPINPRFTEAPVQFHKPLVVLAPFATRINRTWEVHNWHILARNLISAGYLVIALDAPDQPERCRPIGVEYFWGHPPESIGHTCYHASLIIANDSGLAHVGGLFGTPTIVVMTQQDPAKYYSMTNNLCIIPPHTCVGCRFQPSLGYEEKCDSGCWALQSISPTEITRHALEILSTSANKRR